ncbi:flavodoxin family protein [Nocardioides sp. ChNu-153]|uniref:flavodoxin family protein n=1 Tax=Nocardioides sp. ChNu-153 TaxID=2779364 RepID=UPI002652D49B|nr:NAD(P)H-dependent oxidoreductase [Nocardioides sp. ChNu-153]MDN7120752.1 flavodoxin family protein [Nocardioides sp. ChNu-153]
MARLLVVHHSPTRSVRALTDAVLAGAGDDALEGVEVVERPALEATADDVLGCDGVVLGTPANFGYMSGALKHFLDSTFLSIGGALGDDGGTGGATGGGDPVSPTVPPAGRGRLPFGLYVHGRYDTEGAVRSVLAITGALPWRRSAEVLAVLGDVGDADLAGAHELGGTIAALAAG